MNELTLSLRLREYIQEVEDETGYKVIFNLYPELKSTHGYWAACVSPQYDMSNLIRDKTILILFDPNIQTQTIDMERIISHEVTHGYIRHKLKYPMLDGSDIKSISAVITYFEDIIVSKITQDKGFSIYEPLFFAILENDILHIKNHDITSDHLRFILRIVQIRALKQYLNNDTQCCDLFSNYLKVASIYCPNEYRIARNIINLFKTNDIFTRDGYINFLASAVDILEIKCALFYLPE